jgi:hypothetical protein
MPPGSQFLAPVLQATSLLSHNRPATVFSKGQVLLHASCCNFYTVPDFRCRPMLIILSRLLELANRRLVTIALRQLSAFLTRRLRPHNPTAITTACFNVR